MIIHKKIKFFSLALASLPSTLKLINAKPQTIGGSIIKTRDFCSSNPCQNNGECHMEATGRSYICDCINGYSGRDCEIPPPKLTCGTREISIEIDSRMVVGNKLDNNVDLIAFGDSDDDENCRAVLDGNNYKLTIQSPFSKNCGTTAKRADGDTGDYVFSNDVVWKKVYAGNSGEAPIQRRIKLVDFNCHYEDEYMLQMVPIKPAEITIEQQLAKGTFEVDMTLWKNSDFERDMNGQYSSNPIVRVGQEVCVKMNLRSNMDMPNLVLTASNCWAAGSDSPMSEEEKHYIITKKCKSKDDYTTTIKQNGVDNDVKFCFQVHKWESGMDNLYVQCEVSVCDDTIQVSGSSQCVCPPETFETNSWFYPNYYGAQLERMDFDYGDYYNYGNDYSDLYSDSYGNAADVFGNYGNDNQQGRTVGGSIADYSAFENYDSTYMNDYSGNNLFYYDYIAPDGAKKRRRRRAAPKQVDKPEEPTDENTENLINSLPKRTADSDPFNKAANGIRPTKKKRLDLKNLLKQFKDETSGELNLPEGLTIDPKKDLINVGYGPIQIKEAVDPEVLAQRQKELSEVEVTAIEDQGEWFESEEGANSMIIMAVGGSLVFAIIILGVVIGVYVQFSHSSKQKSQDIMAEQQKVKEFYQGVLRSGESASGIPTGPADSQ